MLKTSKIKQFLKPKTDGFALSVEALLASTIFGLTAALTWSLVWNGLNREIECRKELATVNFLKNKIYESGFYESFSKKDIEVFSKDYSETIFKKIFRVSRMEIAEKSALVELGKFANKFVFQSKDPSLKGEAENADLEKVKLVAFLPFFKEEL